MIYSSCVHNTFLAISPELDSVVAAKGSEKLRDNKYSDGSSSCRLLADPNARNFPMQFIARSAHSSDTGLAVSFKNQFCSTICITGGGRERERDEEEARVPPFSEIIKEILRSRAFAILLIDARGTSFCSSFFRAFPSFPILFFFSFFLSSGGTTGLYAIILRNGLLAAALA